MQFIFYKDGQKYTVSNAAFEDTIEPNEAMQQLELHTLHISAETPQEEFDEDLFEPQDGIGLKKEIIN